MKDFEKDVPLLLARAAGGGGDKTEGPQPREPRQGGGRKGNVSSVLVNTKNIICTYRCIYIYI